MRALFFPQQSIFLAIWNLPHTQIHLDLPKAASTLRSAARTPKRSLTHRVP
jgi:hypothetical protein